MFKIARRQDFKCTNYTEMKKVKVMGMLMSLIKSSSYVSLIVRKSVVARCLELSGVSYI
jgi:hypothetical protein